MQTPEEKQFSSTWETSAFFAELFQYTHRSDLVEHACDQIREMTGAATVAYVEHSESEKGCKPVAVNPSRRFELLNKHYEKTHRSRLCPFHHPQPFPLTIEKATDDPAALEVYESLQAKTILRVPIQLSNDKFGSLIIIDLPEEYLINEALDIMRPISSCLCLAIQKAIAVEQLEMKKTHLQEEVELKNLELMEKNRHLQEIILDLELEKSRAEEANRTKSEFLAIMSHELRTPLNPIIGISDILLSKETDDQKIECLNLINDAGSQLLELITDILDFTQIEAGKLSIQPKEIGIRDLIKSVVSTFEGKVITLTTKIDLYLDPDLPETVFLDPLRLRQIAVNLISNAIKFTPEGLIYISLKKDGDNIVLSVKDTGIGIPEDKMATIWEPFRQVDSSISRKHGGSGLGLAIVYKLSRLMSGSVHLESEVGKGTTTTVTLPARL